jgi:regulation of enolase protein 1 (concanavalin A-like superfamily)
MPRTRSIVAILIVVSIALAKPIREAPKTVWGKIEDPDKDCIFKEENGVLSLTVPGKDHDLAAERGKMNSPRAMQLTDGDFTIQVKVAGKFEPRNMDTMERRAYHGAGLFIRKDDNEYITLDRATYWDGMQNVVYANFERRVGGRLERFGQPSDLPLDNSLETWLKIERKGNEFKAYASQEAGKWHELGTKTMEAPMRISIGIAARNSSTEPFTPRFSEYKLERGVGKGTDKK